MSVNAYTTETKSLHTTKEVTLQRKLFYIYIRECFHLRHCSLFIVKTSTSLTLSHSHKYQFLWPERGWEESAQLFFTPVESRDNVNNCQSNTNEPKRRGIRAYNLTYMPSVLKWGNKQAMNCKRRRFSIVIWP